MKESVILHCDLNNFFASCECAIDPSLREVPIAVCGDPQKRHGIVLAKNTLAKQFGVKTAETIWQAKQKCPHLVIVPPHYELYLEYSRRVQTMYLEYSDLVESFGLDECWLDVTASELLFGSGAKIADELRSRVREEIGLTLSIGVAPTKVFAKLGSDMKKPDATTVITRENLDQTAWKLPVGEMLFIGAKTVEKLQKLGIRTIGQLANANEKMLSDRFGIIGVKMRRSAAGLDSDPVRSYYDKQELKSVGHGVTLPQDIATPDQAYLTIQRLSEMIATRLRRYGLKAGGVQLHLRDYRLECFSKQKTIPLCDTPQPIAKSAYELFLIFFRADNPIRTLTIGTYHLEHTDAPVQQSMFDRPTDAKHRQLSRVVDNIRNKYGQSSIERGILLSNSFILDHTADEDDLLPFKRG